MFKRILRTSSLLLPLIVFGTFLAQARDLTFEDRIQAQDAIERFYYSHQIGATRSFDQVVPTEVLERKVRAYLAQSVALERMWHTPVTALMLERELERMASRTRMPDRLQGLFAALNDDPVLIQECLARQVLVDRLTRNFFAADPRVHARARQDAETLRQGLLEGRIDPLAEHSTLSVIVLQRSGEGQAEPQLLTDHDRRLVELEPERFDDLRGLAPQRVGAIGAVTDEREAFTLRIVLEELVDQATIATYAIPKLGWDEWWSEAGSALDGMAVEVVASSHLSLPRMASIEGRDCEGNIWDNGTLDDLPGHRSRHSAVWTGSRMIVWGGYLGNWLRQTGMAYDPATDSWTVTSVVDAPWARSGHSAVWTGEEMIVWGGGGWYPSNTGGRYDPVADSWLPTSTGEAPEARSAHSAIWTGEEMIVWGGSAGAGVMFNTGGRYDPESDSWVATNSKTGPDPRGGAATVWTGERMLIWGGWTELGAVNTGWSYNPADDSWTLLPGSGLSARNGATGVWTGTEMIVWGGTGPGQYEKTGARYAPATNSWTSMTIAGAPEERTQHTAVWTGNEMIVWGGAYGDLNTGGRYDPATNSWAPTTTVGAPDGRTNHTAVWAGDRMIVWGGTSYTIGYQQFATGGRYDPVSDSWTPTYAAGAPYPRGYHSAVWTGNEMIVWGGGYWAGGDGLYIEAVDTGSRYNPATDSWAPSSTSNAPTRRYGHTAVWSGAYMVVWGGENDYDNGLATGGRYEPISNSWGPTSLTGAPSARTGHTAVWTGAEMIVWGGSGGGFLNSGARYDPWANVWAAMSPVDVPAQRSHHSAVWTGDEMIVWGGYDYHASPSYLDTGGRYDPAADSWSATQAAEAPDGRIQHSAVWTGAEMIVWGGGDNQTTNTGGRYAPATDSWTPTSTTAAPSGRINHSALWVGNRMIVWAGGENSWGSDDTNTGGLYDPLDDSWVPTSIVDAPPPRSFHSTAGVGDTMIVWGGEGPLSDGGGYHPFGLDGDGDGYACLLDCDDSDSNTHPDAPETNDGLDNQCPGDAGHGVIDEISGNSGFHDPDDTSEYSWPRQKGAGSYEVVRSTRPYFSGDCTVWSTTATHVNDLEDPAPGRIFFYLSRAVAPSVGSWGQHSNGVERTGVCP